MQLPFIDVERDEVKRPQNIKADKSAVAEEEFARL